MLLNKEALLNKLESKKLTTVFVASSLAMIFQFSLSKKFLKKIIFIHVNRARYWLYNTTHILLYITGITLSTGNKNQEQYLNFDRFFCSSWN